MSREYTEQECRDMLLDHIWHMIRYWKTTETDRDRMEGLAFSILVALDGEAADLPKFIVAPDPRPDDKAYCQGRGVNWWPENCDLGSSLHDLFHSRRPNG